MAKFLDRFEAIVRAAVDFSDVSERDQPADVQAAVSEQQLHPFDKRNIHPRLPKKVRTFFDDGHYAESTFEAFKYLDKVVQGLAGSNKSGEKLMMDVFSESSPTLKLTPLNTQSEQDEQRGFKFLFSGGVIAIRNPRGHEVDQMDDVDTCLDHLAFVSLLIRRLEQAGYK
ncbi:MAG: TIGR02391 family protein [Dyella sp.]|uniref:TIGR02391 family protein n=1 Tax=Dyella sp. TaxID=1869338 RepID=UPI003F7FF11E